MENKFFHGLDQKLSGKKRLQWPSLLWFAGPCQIMTFQSIIISSDLLVAFTFQTFEQIVAVHPLLHDLPFHYCLSSQNFNYIFLPENSQVLYRTHLPPMLFFFLTFYFVLEYSRLIMLW